LWFDLMHDVLALREPSQEGVSTIAAYYRRVTTEARPMNRLVALAMLLTVAAVVAEVVRGSGPAWARWSSLVLVLAPVSLAGLRTVPRAVRLGAGADPFGGQASLARSILREHIFCLVSIAALLVIQLVGVG
jgi:hypothetical protein